MPLQVHQFACLNDNYSWLVHEPEANVTAVVDTPEVAPILRALDQKGWKLTHILNTHWHPDHAGGNDELKAKTGCQIIGPRAEAKRIPSIERPVGDGDEIKFGTATARVFDVPGHTSGHVAYWFAQDKIAFVGDTLFALGCGRLFEGTAQQMWTSLQKLMALPPETKVYCAHEYTQSNARFALSVDPENEALVARSKEIDAMRAKGIPTVPSNIGLELATNPFLRPASLTLQRSLGMVGADPVEVFAETRRRKDKF
ncbi:MAG: hydroxyacylglutathione hydrolase [Alphaproteobacteria bacterium]|nr:hydroxyacylglutathione hydrolase [Alphaproteobacteria bacterium]